MKVLDAFVLLILFALLFISLYFLWSNLPIGSEEFETYTIELPPNLPQESVQFYQNMRYVDRRISYSLSEACSRKKIEDFELATRLLQEKTLLSFYRAENDAEIIVTCSNIAPRAEERNHFVAGEGGPSRIINGSRFAIILEGRIALYRTDTCEEPKIALHEILHVLGFNHNNNSASIMYPVTNCAQQIDSSIIREINRLYSISSLPDLTIEKVSANKSGRYLNFDLTIANNGLKDAKNILLKVVADSSFIETFEIDTLEIGTKRHLTVTNLRIPRSTEKLTFIIETRDDEISKSNNDAVLNLLQES